MDKDIDVLIPSLVGGYFNIANNVLRFGHLEETFNWYNGHVPTFAYSPQARVNNNESYFPLAGHNRTLTTIVSGSDNNYQWYKSGKLIPGATNSTYEIINANKSDSAIYLALHIY